MKRPTSEADRAIWATYERASARAADQYDALPIAAARGGRLHKCDRCSTDVAGPGLCRWCRRAS